MFVPYRISRGCGTPYRSPVMGSPGAAIFIRHRISARYRRRTGVARIDRPRLGHSFAWAHRDRVG